MMIRAINYALLGINRNMRQYAGSARNISGGAGPKAAGGARQAEAPPRTRHISGEVVRMMAAGRAVEANIQALKAADRTLGSLVNISA